eukprot:210594-Chlamydomonas_euryale.AAC.5
MALKPSRRRAVWVRPRWAGEGRAPTRTAAGRSPPRDAKGPTWRQAASASRQSCRPCRPRAWLVRLFWFWKVRDVETCGRSVRRGGREEGSREFLDAGPLHCRVIRGFP